MNLDSTAFLTNVFLMRRFNPERKDVLFANTETAKYFIENFIDFNASGNFA